jgi:hypothetical protein
VYSDGAPGWMNAHAPSRFVLDHSAEFYLTLIRTPREQFGVLHDFPRDAWVSCHRTMFEIVSDLSPVLSS